MRQKIDFGIDLGTTNSAIAFMQDGEAVIIKSDDNQMDTTPSCVAFNKKQAIFIGLNAKQFIEKETINFQKNGKQLPLNGYQEFKRTMGTDQNYYSSNMDKNYNSEQLSAEVLKKLKGYVREEDVNAAVITVPAMFKQSQLDATQRAAELAGFSYCELLQEPIAASIAYGIKASQESGYWLVFDFGGGTFDAALMHVEDGIMKVVDTEGDNHLGGKDLDVAIVDQLLIPQISRQCSLEVTIDDNAQKELLQNALKGYAERAKIALSSKSEWKEFLEDIGEDDDGEEIEADVSITLAEYEQAVSHIFQRAIDIAKNVLSRNNLFGSDLTSLIMVGGPTFQQTLRRMLQEQITPNVDTSIDPMTAVAKGAALFASTKDIPRDLQKRDISKAQLTLKYPETTVETSENLGIRIDRDESTANLPNSFILEIIRNDGAWSSGKLSIDNDMDIVELQLVPGKTNQFNIKLFSSEGSVIPCEPSAITIIQGLKIASATLPYSVGLEIFDSVQTKQGVFTLEGLEKNKTLPAKGKGKFKTMKDIRAGMRADELIIPIYEYRQEGSRAITNTFFGQMTITGADIPSFLPSGSEVEVTLNIDASRRGQLSVYIPAIDESFDLAIESQIEKDVSSTELKREIREARRVAISLASEGNIEAEKKLQELNEVENLLDARGEDRDTKQKVKTQLQETFVDLDKYEENDAWPKAKNELDEAMARLRRLNEEEGNAKTRSMMFDYESEANQIINKQDIKGAKKLAEQIQNLSFDIQSQNINFWVGFIIYADEEFNSIKWIDEREAYRAISQAKKMLNSNPTFDQVVVAVQTIVCLMSPESQAEMQNANTSLLRR